MTTTFENAKKIIDKKIEVEKKNGYNGIDIPLDYNWYTEINIGYPNEELLLQIVDWAKEKYEVEKYEVSYSVDTRDLGFNFCRYHLSVRWD